jgi:hypothetical protein
VHLPGSRHPGVEFDLAKRALIPRYVLLQDRHQRLGLLRAQINALKVSDFHLGFALLLQGAEDQEEIPDIHAHLDAVGVALAIVGSVHQPDIGLRWITHMGLV